MCLQVATSPHGEGLRPAWCTSNMKWSCVCRDHSKHLSETSRHNLSWPIFASFCWGLKKKDRLAAASNLHPSKVSKLSQSVLGAHIGLMRSSLLWHHQNWDWRAIICSDHRNLKLLTPKASPSFLTSEVHFENWLHPSKCRGRQLLHKDQRRFLFSSSEQNTKSIFTSEQAKDAFFQSLGLSFDNR